MKNKYINNLRNLLYIAFNNLKRENKATSLGFVWLMFNPLIEAATYSLIFGIFFPGEVDGVNKLPWIIIGSFTWSYLSRAFLSGMDSYYANTHLVTKLKFPLKNIPLIHIAMEYLRFMLFWVIIVLVLWVFKIYPTFNYIWIIYATIASTAFLVAATRLFATIGTLVKDISKLINALFGIVFWLSGAILDVNSLKDTHHTIYLLIKLNPFEYLLNTWRDIFINKSIFVSGQWTYHILFWSTTLVMYLLGNYVFKKFKGDFADII